VGGWVGEWVGGWEEKLKIKFNPAQFKFKLLVEAELGNK
jgi:hypothetical protein